MTMRISEALNERKAQIVAQNQRFKPNRITSAAYEHYAVRLKFGNGNWHKFLKAFTLDFMDHLPTANIRITQTDTDIILEDVAMETQAMPHFG